MSNPEGFQPGPEVNQNDEKQDLIFKLVQEIESAMPDVLKRAKKIAKENKTGLNDQNWDQAFEESFGEAAQDLKLSETYEPETIQKAKQRVEMKYQMYANQVRNMLGPQD